MRKVLFSALALAVLVPAARGQDDAKAIVEKAIQAHGGAAALDKYKAGRIKSKGVVSVAGMEITVAGTSVYQLPDKSKSQMEMETMGQKIAVVQLVTGDKVTMSLNGMKRDDLPEAQLAEMKVPLYLQTVYQLTPLLKEPFALKALGESKFQDRPVLGVQVSSKGQKDVKLYFDKESGLLVRLERTGLDPQSLEESPLEQVFSDYKDFGGIKRPVKTTVLQGGKKFLESEVLEFKPLEQVEAKEFELDS
jgi:hypothetical protein